MKNTIKGWVARDSDGRLLFYTDKPWKCTKSWGVSEGEWMELDKSWYPDVKWEDEEPREASVAMIDEGELTHGKTVKTEEVPDDRAYCKEHCKGYRESGGKCYFGFNCCVKKEAEAEKNLKLYKREPEKRQTMEIKSTKEAEEIINFIKDCFDKLKQNFHGYCLDIDWKYYEAALEVLRPEYTSYQQGFNAGYEEGYLSRKRVEKEFVEEIKGYLDELKDVNIDEE